MLAALLSLMLMLYFRVQNGEERIFVLLTLIRRVVRGITVTLIPATVEQDCRSLPHCRIPFPYYHQRITLQVMWAS